MTTTAYDKLKPDWTSMNRTTADIAALTATTQGYIYTDSQNRVEVLVACRNLSNKVTAQTDVEAVATISSSIATYSGFSNGGTPHLGTSDIITITLVMSETVNVTGAPYIAVNINSVVRHAVYASGTGTNTLLFTYTLTAADLATAGQVTFGTAVVMAGSIKDVISGEPDFANVIPTNVYPTITVTSATTISTLTVN